MSRVIKDTVVIYPKKHGRSSAMAKYAAVEAFGEFLKLHKDMPVIAPNAAFTAGYAAGWSAAIHSALEPCGRIKNAPVDAATSDQRGNK